MKTFFITKQPRNNLMPATYLISRDEIKREGQNPTALKVCAQTFENVTGIKLEPRETAVIKISLE